MTDEAFAVSIRRLLISIAKQVKKRYGTEVLLIILTGKGEKKYSR